ncbi:benzoate 4-monooxygenase cytochrome P450 [Durotheca rogersii]|uniref:benzoate 4-monooxygenase cytochrome P450 n=1 Tax=Durotheca rogersii TaxID=419775 RepID=UPI00221EED22|nr:benzoate 4-monooxygenase cytochrome P450 [Durotheca rogersii]KAI5854530.1 benzoate 4-monooxygenase cytochrome P450 [Durotheca rogersii]
MAWCDDSISGVEQKSAMSADVSHPVAVLQNTTRAEILAFIILLLLALGITKVIYNVFFHPLAAVPGPKLFAISAIPISWSRVRGTSPYKFAELHEEYGPVVRVSPNEVSCAGTTAFKDVYGPRYGKGGPLPRDTRTATLKEMFGAVGMFQASVQEHARIRRQLSPAFSEKASREQEPLVRGYINSMLQKLRDASERGEAVDIEKYTMWATFDIQGDLVFGEDVFGCIREERYHPWINISMTFFTGSVYTHALNDISPWALWIWQRFLTPKSLVDAQSYHIKTTLDLVDKRMAAGKTNHPDYMSFIAGESKAGEMLTKEQMYANAQMLVMAGSETVATTSATTLFLLLTHPKKMDRVKREIRSAFDSDQSVTAASVAQLPYLMAVIDESMRVWPPVATSFNPRQVPSGGCTVDGYFIPEGLFVGIHNHAIGRLEGYFRGAKEFVPERWLGDERYSSDARGLFQPFSSGPMNCIGLTMGRMETRVILARLIYNFDIELMPECSSWLENQKNYIAWHKPPLLVKLTRVD